jgi:hypothetical protein
MHIVTKASVLLMSTSVYDQSTALLMKVYYEI